MQPKAFNKINFHYAWREFLYTLYLASTNFNIFFNKIIYQNLKADLVYYY